MAVIKINAAEFKAFDEKKFNPRLVYGSGEIKVIVAYFKPGQFIPVHTPKVDVIFCILEGRAELVAGPERFEVREKDLIVVPRGTQRGIRALTELTVLHIVQPPPDDEDHREVHRKLAAGKFE